jgi:hypothetical protein
LDEEGAKILKEEDWWFEAEDGSPLKWCARNITVFNALLTLDCAFTGTGR